MDLVLCPLAMAESIFKRAIIILADGARPDVLSEEMQRGRLPHLARLAEGGTHKTMLTCFPSTTGPAYLPYITGCFPGTCNIPGIRWFDKPVYAKKGWGPTSFRSYCGLESVLLNRDMAAGIPCAWEVFDRPKSILGAMTRGLARKNNLTSGMRIWYYYYAHLTDRWHFVDRLVCDRLTCVIKDRDFDFVFAVLPSIDEFSHRSSPFHPRVRGAYAEIDALVGRILAALKTFGLSAETLVCLVSDHGLSETRHHFDIGPWLESEKKIPTLYYTNVFKRRFEAASMISGNGMAHLYFQGENGWGYRKSFEEISYNSILLDELRHRDEVDLVVTEGAGGAIHFQTERGHGSFVYNPDDGLIHYDFDRDDPLGIFKKNDEELVSGFTFDRGLELTSQTDYPDVFLQMHQLFRSPRTGDVVVSARVGFDLRKRFEHPVHKASHGSIHPEHMRVPLIMNYPIKTDRIRSVDVFPTVLKLLGKTIPENMDGRALQD